tara:strand:+ start:650 stop:1411 length:762 start_codon:yes stop_codon:yes gene_type:complete
MKEFDYKKYLAEGKLLKEELEVGTTIEINPSSFPNFEFPYGTRGEISSIDTADHASDDLVYTVKLKHIDSQGTTNDTLHIENPNQYLDEGKLNENKDVYDLSFTDDEREYEQVVYVIATSPQDALDKVKNDEDREHKYTMKLKSQPSLLGPFDELEEWEQNSFNEKGIAYYDPEYIDENIKELQKNLDFLKYLDEGKLLKEEGKTLVYIVVEEGDNNQYTLSDMKVFSNRNDADDYADSFKYGGTMVFQMEVI